MARGNFIGIKLGGDASGFNKAINKSISTLSSMNHSVRQGVKYLDTYGAAATKAQRSLRDLRVEQQKFAKQARIANIRNKQQRFAKDSPQFARLQYQLENAKTALGNLSARHQLVKEMDAIDEARNRFRNRMHAVGIALGTGLIAGYASVVTGTALVNGAMNAVNQASNLEVELAKAGAIGGFGANSSKEKLLRKTILDVASKTKFSPAEVGKQMTDLLAQGLTVDQARQAAGPLADFMTATFGIASDKMAKVIGVSLNKFALPEHLENTAQKTEYLADRFITLRNISPINSDQFEGMLASLGSAQQLTGSTVDQLFTMMAMFARAGKSGREAAQAYKSMGRISIKNAQDMTHFLDSEEFLNLATRGGAKRADVLQRIMGISMKDLLDNKGNLKSTFEIFGTLIERMNSFDNARDIKAIAGALRTLNITGLDSLLTLMSGKGFDDEKQGVAAIAQILQAFKNADGASKRSADRYLKTFRGLMDLIGGLAQVIFTLIGEPLLKVAKGPLTILKNTLQSISDYLRANPEVSKWVGYALMGIGVFVVLGGVILTVVSAIGLMVMGIAEIVALIGGLTVMQSVFLALAPVIAGVAIAALAIGSYFGKDAFAASGLKVFAQKVKNVGLIFEGLKQIFSTGKIENSLVDELGKSGLLGVVTSIYHYWLLFKKAFNEVKGNINNISGFGTLKSEISDLLDNLNVLYQLITNNTKTGGKGRSIFENMVTLITMFVQVGIAGLTLLLAGVNLMLGGIVTAINIIISNWEAFWITMAIVAIAITFVSLGFIALTAVMLFLVGLVGAVVAAFIVLIGLIVYGIYWLYQEIKKSMSGVSSSFDVVKDSLNLMGSAIGYVVGLIGKFINGIGLLGGMFSTIPQSSTQRSKSMGDIHDNFLRRHNELDKFNSEAKSDFSRAWGNLFGDKKDSKPILNTNPLDQGSSPVQQNNNKTTQNQNNIDFRPQIKIETIGSEEELIAAVGEPLQRMLQDMVEREITKRYEET